MYMCIALCLCMFIHACEPRAGFLRVGIRRPQVAREESANHSLAASSVHDGGQNRRGLEQDWILLDCPLRRTRVQVQMRPDPEGCDGHALPLCFKMKPDFSSCYVLLTITDQDDIPFRTRDVLGAPSICGHQIDPTARHREIGRERERGTHYT